MSDLLLAALAYAAIHAIVCEIVSRLFVRLVDSPSANDWSVMRRLEQLEAEAEAREDDEEDAPIYGDDVPQPRAAK